MEKEGLPSSVHVLDTAERLLIKSYLIACSCIQEILPEQIQASNMGKNKLEQHLK